MYKKQSPVDGFQKIFRTAQLQVLDRHLRPAPHPTPHPIWLAGLTRGGGRFGCAVRDLGARIIKIELPRSGDVTRHSTPLVEREDGGRYDVSADQRSGFFAMANTGKESIALDLKDDADREVLEALISKADVLVENFSPGVMAGLGYDWDSVHAKWPSIVMASISGFGQTGPLSPNRALDTVIQGMSGLMSVTGFADREPVRVGASISDMMSGMCKQLSPPTFESPSALSP